MVLAVVAAEVGPLLLVGVLDQLFHEGLSGEAQARALMATLRTIPGITIPSIVEGGGGAR